MCSGGPKNDLERYPRHRLQSVMRHSTITLTMDAYGHLLPGATADAADQLGAMVGGSLLSASDDAHENILQMTGTDGRESAQRVAQQLGRDSVQFDATRRRELI